MTIALALPRAEPMKLHEFLPRSQASPAVTCCAALERLAVSLFGLLHVQFVVNKRQMLFYDVGWDSFTMCYRFLLHQVCNAMCEPTQMLVHTGRVRPIEVFYKIGPFRVLNEHVKFFILPGT